MNTIHNGSDWKQAIAPILTFGALWGFAEATLGFALHTVSRLLPVPNLAGAVMFPVALFFMVAAIRTTRKPGAAMGAAVVAAAIKASSLALPVVRFAFVRSPVLAILAEGGIIAVGAAAGLMPFLTGRSGTEKQPASFPRRGAFAFLAALVISTAWRGTFLGLNVLLGITGGIMSKPAVVLLRFVSVESVWNAAIIAVVVTIAVARNRTNSSTAGTQTTRNSVMVRSPVRIGRPAGPIGVTLALVLAVLSEWGVAYLPV